MERNLGEHSRQGIAGAKPGGQHYKTLSASRAALWNNGSVVQLYCLVSYLLVTCDYPAFEISKQCN